MDHIAFLLEVREFAVALEAIQPCPRHVYVFLRGSAEAVAAAYFKIGGDQERRRALDHVVRETTRTCDACANEE